MPHQVCSIMDQRQGFVIIARQEGANIAALCRQYGIRRRTGYCWLERATTGRGGLGPSQPPTAHLAAPHRRGGGSAHPGVAAAAPGLGWAQAAPPAVDLGVAAVPAPSTITAILRRHGLLSPIPPRRDCLRFERAAANELWQLDFMGIGPWRTAGSTP